MVFRGDQFLDASPRGVGAPRVSRLCPASRAEAGNVFAGGCFCQGSLLWRLWRENVVVLVRDDDFGSRGVEAIFGGEFEILVDSR